MGMIRTLPRAAPRFAAAAAVLFAVAACEPVRRTVDFDRTADFSDYATFVWVAEEAAPTAAGAPPLNPLVEQRVQDAIERARDLLAFRPAVDLDEGLERTMAWMRETGATKDVLGQVVA